MPDPSFDRRAARQTVLARADATEHRMQIAGVETAVLVSGEGPPMVLLHGPGESSLWYIRVLDELAGRFRVIVPDLPGHGESSPAPRLDEATAVAWLEELVKRTCSQPPVLVGHVIGGAVAARFAARYPRHVAQLVLVDALGLAPFDPDPAFGQGLHGFLAKPDRETYQPFLDECLLDAPNVARALGDAWDPFLDYYVACINDTAGRAMGEIMEALGLPAIAAADLKAITAPTALIWGVHDKATSVRVARAASRQYGWPLHVIEGSGDDPKMEKPKEFVSAIETLVASRDDR